MRLIAVATVIWLVCAPHAQAAQTGASLKGICEDQGEQYQGLCTGYVMAIADILTQFSIDESYFLGFRACMPEISVVKAKEVVVAFLDSHPASLEKSAFSVVTRALAEAYPCG